MNCFDLKLKVKEWSLKVLKTNGLECDMVVGKHVTIVQLELVKKLSDPFMLPFPDALYLQTSELGMKVKYYLVNINSSFFN